MRRVVAMVIVVWLVSLSTIAGAQTASGQANFTKLCSACHTIGGGRRVGPDLKGANDRHSQDWLVKWVTSSQGMVHSGDSAAVKLFKDYNIAMPDAALSPDEIRGVLAYIRATGEGTAAAAAAAEEVSPATPEEIQTGRELFQGGIRLANGGPACSSCHHVTNDAVIGGGVLAKELTTASSRLGTQGIQAILSAPPFPVMQQAFATRPLTKSEMTALTAYLQYVSARPASFDQPRTDSLKLLYGGLGGFSVLMLLYGIIWRRRKKYPVSKPIFDRQVRSR